MTNPNFPYTLRGKAMLGQLTALALAVHAMQWTVLEYLSGYFIMFYYF